MTSIETSWVIGVALIVVSGPNYCERAGHALQVRHERASGNPDAALGARRRKSKAASPFAGADGFLGT
jgi:hypothetical protein